jgi:antitoxin (DNA-binding transcriptional repressor) of toxin-antitoxin stability system
MPSIRPKRASFEWFEGTKETTITVTDAARNFADCVNRAHYLNMTFVLLKNGKPVARIEPDDEKRCMGRDLAGALAKVELSPAEARDWHRDLRTARKTVKTPAGRRQ